MFSKVRRERLDKNLISSDWGFMIGGVDSDGGGDGSEFGVVVSAELFEESGVRGIVG